MANTIVSSTTATEASGSARQAHIIFAANSGRWWAFFLTAANSTVHSYYSSDGVTWTAGNTLTLSASASEGGDFAVAYANISSNDVIHLAFGNGTNDIHYRATISGTTITWGSATTTSMDGYSGFDITTAITSDGYICDSFNGNGSGEACTFPNKDSGSSWTPGTATKTIIYQGTVNNAISLALVSYNTGKFLEMYDNGEESSWTDGTASFTVHYATDTAPSSWGSDSGLTWTATAEEVNDWGIVCRVHGSTPDVHLVHRTGSSSYEHKRWNGTSWSAGDSISTQTSLSGGGNCLASDGTNVWLFVLDSATGNNVKVCKWTSGTGWSSWSTVESSSATRTYLGVAPQQDASGSLNWLVYWTDGTGSPWKINCALYATAAGGTAWSQSLTDAISSLDTVLKTGGKALKDAISALDTLLKGENKSFSDWVSALDTLTKQVTKALLEAESSQDSLSRQPGKAVTDPISSLDSFTKATGKGLSDSVSETDVFVRTWQAHLTLLGSISQLDTLAKMPAKTFLDWLSEVDSLTVQKLSGAAWVKNLSDATSALDVLLKTPGKWNSDSISTVDVFSRVWTAHLTLQEWLSEADTWAKSVVKSTQDTSVDVDSLAKTSVKTLGDAQSSQDSLSKGGNKGLSDVTSATDAITKSFFKQYFDSLSETDKIAAGRLLLVNLLDAASLTDQVSTLIVHPTGQFALAQVISLVAAALGMTISLLVGTALAQLITNFAPGPLSETISNF